MIWRPIWLGLPAGSVGAAEFGRAHAQVPILPGKVFAAVDGAASPGRFHFEGVESGLQVIRVRRPFEVA